MMKPMHTASRTSAVGSRNWIVAGLVLLLAVACTPKKTDGPPEPDPLTLTLQQTLAADREEVLISTFSGLAVGNDGTIYASDTDQQRIYVFSAEGVFRDTLGREGKGPGEFSSLNATIHVLGDTLYALQRRERRVDRFNLRTGEVLRTISLPEAGAEGVDLGQPQKIIPQRGGNLLVVFLNPHYRAPEAGAPAKYVTVARVNSAGELVGRQLVRRPSLYPSDGRLVLMEPGRVSVFGTDIYPTHQFTATPGGRIYAGTTDSLRITAYSPAGEPVQTLSADFEPAPFEESDLDTLVKQGGETFEKAVRSVGMPERYPAFYSMLTDGKGRLWVALREPDADRRRWWVFDRDGQLQARADVPSGVTLHAIRGDRAYGIARSAEALPEIRVFHIGQPQ